MKTTHSAIFHLVSEHYDVLAKSQSIDELIAIVRKGAKEAEQNCESTFICRIIAVKYVEVCGDSIRHNAYVATLIYTNGDLDISYNFDYED